MRQTKSTERTGRKLGCAAVCGTVGAVTGAAAHKLAGALSRCSCTQAPIDPECSKLCACAAGRFGASPPASGEAVHRIDGAAARFNGAQRILTRRDDRFGRCTDVWTPLRARRFHSSHFRHVLLQDCMRLLVYSLGASAGVVGELACAQVCSISVSCALNRRARAPLGGSLLRVVERWRKHDRPAAAPQLGESVARTDSGALKSTDASAQHVKAGVSLL